MQIEDLHKHFKLRYTAKSPLSQKYAYQDLRVSADLHVLIELLSKVIISLYFLNTRSNTEVSLGKYLLQPDHQLVEAGEKVSQYNAINTCWLKGIKRLVLIPGHACWSVILPRGVV